MDKIEDDLGKPTLYQIRAIVAAGFLLIAGTATPQTGVFYNAVPDHRCLLPILDHRSQRRNATEEKILQFTIPDGDSCHQYRYGNQSACENTTFLSCFENAGNAEIVPCAHGYFYDDTYFAQTVVSEWDLVCNNQIWDSFTKSLYFAGALFGAPPTGYLVDRFGRKLMSITLCVGLLAAGLGCSFAPSFLLYCLFRFLEGATGLPTLIALYPYLNEMAGRKYRVFIGTTALLIVSVTHTLQTLAAFFLRNWRHLNLFFALLTLPYLVMCPFIPKSPRWLLMKGKTEEAWKVLNRYAASKGRMISDDDWKSVVVTEKEKTERADQGSRMSDLFRLPCTRVVTIITLYLWFSITGVFYGLVLNVGNLAGDPYLNAALNGFTEMVAMVMYSLLTFKYGSLGAMSTGLFCSGTLCLVAVVAKQFSHISSAALQVVRWSSIAGKLFITISFAASYQYTPDVNPTVSRGKVMGLAACFGRIGSTVIPFLLTFQLGSTPVADVRLYCAHIANLDIFSGKLHFVQRVVIAARFTMCVRSLQITFGIMGLSAAGLSLLMPNTSRKVFLTTLEDAEDYYRENMKRFSLCIGKESTTRGEAEPSTECV